MTFSEHKDIMNYEHYNQKNYFCFVLVKSLSLIPLKLKTKKTLALYYISINIFVYISIYF
jgi:hypothetical protein